MSEQLSVEEAFAIMKQFLIQYYERTHSDDTASLLGDLNILPDGVTADSAAWQDYVVASKAVISRRANRESETKFGPCSMFE